MKRVSSIIRETDYVDHEIKIDLYKDKFTGGYYVSINLIEVGKVNNNPKSIGLVRLNMVETIAMFPKHIIRISANYIKMFIIKKIPIVGKILEWYKFWFCPEDFTNWQFLFYTLFYGFIIILLIYLFYMKFFSSFCIQSY